MKKIFVLVAGLTLSAAVSAEGTGISANISSLGFGLDLTKSLSESVTGRVGFNAYSLGRSMTESGVDYDAKLKWQSMHLLADWYPMQGTFRTSFGLLYNDNKLSMTAKPSAGSTYTINGTSYNATDIGSLTGEVSFNKTSPYIGIGWGNPVEKSRGWGFVADVGAIYQGAPRPALTAICSSTVPAPTCAQLQSDTLVQQTKLTSDLNNYKWYPVLSVGASYQF